MSTIRTPLVRTIHPSPACVDVTGGLFTFGADLSLCLSPAFVPQELDAVRSLWDAFTAQCCPLQVQSDPAYASYQAWFGPAAPSLFLSRSDGGKRVSGPGDGAGDLAAGKRLPRLLSRSHHTAPVDSAPLSPGGSGTVCRALCSHGGPAGHRLPLYSPVYLSREQAVAH